MSGACAGDILDGRPGQDASRTAKEPRMTSTPLPPPLAQRLSRRFRCIVVFSGAGMSAESGIPTFRSGRDSLWGHFDPRQLATPQAWARDKSLVWAWYEWRRGRVMAAQPHPGHHAVARLQRRLGAQVVTQNVDDLHERAGVKDVVHLHGSFFAARCDACGRPHALAPPPQVEQQRLEPPACGHCRGSVRPGVVWFGEELEPDDVDRASRRIAACDLLLIVGTSGVVYPAAGMVRLAPAGSVIVEINPEPGEAPARIDYRWATTAAVGLPAIAGLLAPEQPASRIQET